MTAHKALLILAMLTALFYPSDAWAQELNSREKSDLVIFRTKDYALMEHSTLESLLNMLPGIRVDKKGNISLNFDDVVEILVDGVEIFGEGRKTIALRNIQAYGIEEIWFYKKDGSVSKLLDYGMGDDVRVMDVRLKKGYQTGKPLDLKAGIGSGEEVHYKGNLLGLYNMPHTRFLVYGSADNLNEDELTNTYAPWNTEGHTNGVLTNYSGGISVLNYLGEGKDSYITTSAGVAEDNTDCQKTTSTRVSLSGREIVVDGTGNSTSENLKANTNTRLHLENAKNFHDASLSLTYSSLTTAGRNDIGMVNIQNTVSALHQKTDASQRQYLLHGNYEGGIRMGRGIVKWGTHLSYNNSRNKDNLFYALSHPPMSLDTIYRYNSWNSPMQTANGDVSVGYEAHDLGLLDRMEVYYVYDCTWQSVDSILQVLNGTKTEVDMENSYSSTVLTQRHNILLTAKSRALSFVGIPLTTTLNVPIRFVSRHMDYRRLHNNTYQRHDILCEPSMEIEYGGRHTFKLYAGLSAVMPPMLYCTPFRNTSNPVQIIMGNTELDNWHDLRLKFTHERTTSASAYYKTTIEYRRTFDALGKNVHFEEQTGIFTTMPVNVDGNWGVEGNFWTNTHLGSKDSHFSLENHFRTSYAHNIELTCYEDMANSMRSHTHSVALANGFLLRYRPSAKWDLRTILSAMWIHSHSDIPNYTTINTANLYYGLRLQVMLPWQIRLGNTFMVNTARGYLNEDLNGDRFIWNAQISRAFFRDRLIVAMKGYDMLAQISNIYHTSTPISTTEVSSNVVPRSFLLTLTWKMHK